jgi:hypothetical protein
MKKAGLIIISLVLIIILLLIVGNVVFSPRSKISMSSTSMSQPPSNNSYAELLRFAERLMTDPGTPLGKPVSMLPGNLPSDLSENIPIPDGTEIIGSLVRSDGKYNQVQIILDSPRDPDEVIEFYRSNLSKAGWNESKVFYPESGGFSSAPSMSESATFCRYERKGPSLTVSAYASDGEKPTDVGIQLDTNPQTSVCTQRFSQSYYETGGAGGAGVMPVLKSPKGAVGKGSGGGGSEDQWESHATLETEISVKDLESHYRNQLVEAGWKLKEKGSNGSIAWSTWSFTDESGGHQSGVLFVSELGQENVLFVMFTVHLVS